MIAKLISRIALMAMTFFIPVQVFAVTVNLTPEAGTWYIPSEFDGKPGRGFQLDVQNSTLVMYFYGYNTSGQGKFYLAAGNMSSNSFTGDLGTYSGGASFGSSPKDANYDGSAGKVTLSFDSPTSGTITLPGESAKPIKRYVFGYDLTSPQSLLGVWAGIYIVSSPYAILIKLTHVDATITSGHGSGAALSADGSIGCEIQTSGTLAGGVLCVQSDSSGNLANTFYFADYSINGAAGYWLSPTTNTTYPAQVWRTGTSAGRYIGASVPNPAAIGITANSAPSGSVVAMRDQQEFSSNAQVKAFQYTDALQQSAEALFRSMK